MIRIQLCGATTASSFNATVIFGRCGPQKPRRVGNQQNPLDFFEGWFAGIERKALTLGDYSIAGLEDACVVERKDLSDLIHSCTTDRCVFIKRLRQMAQYPHRLLLVTTTLSQIKSPHSHAGVNPNRITQSLIAALAGLQVPFLCSETHELWEELVASYLYQVHLYHWLEVI